MRFVIYGAGAIGGSLGALLTQAGYEVALIARGAHLEALRANGLVLKRAEGESRHRLAAFGTPQEVDWRDGDVVVLAMKTQDTVDALRSLPPGVPVVTMQNGVANERMALRLFRDVYPVCVMFPALHLEPGVVVAFSAPTPGILDVGRYPSGVDAKTNAIAQAFRDAGFRCDPRADIMRWKYTKLLMNLGNAVEAVCGRSREVSDIVARLREEARVVLDAAGIAYASDAENTEHRGGTITIAEIDGVPRGGSSSWQSLARGTGTIEADYLNGEIVLLGRLHGVPTKWNENARRIANRAAHERAAPGSLSTEEWLSELDLVA